MIGYGIPQTNFPESFLIGAIGRTFYDWRNGYLYNTDMWYALTGDHPDFHDEDWNVWDDWRGEDEDHFLRGNDFYFAIRAKKIQRWFRSFGEN